MAVEITLTFDDDGYLTGATKGEKVFDATPDDQLPEIPLPPGLSPGQAIRKGVMWLNRENPTCEWCFRQGRRKVCVPVTCPPE